jgi:hypothetical protein
MSKNFLYLFLLIFISNSLVGQTYEINEELKESIKETAKSERVYNYILSSLELHWEKENQLISEKEFF